MIGLCVRKSSIQQSWFCIMQLTGVGNQTIPFYKGLEHAHIVVLAPCVKHYNSLLSFSDMVLNLIIHL